MYVIVISCKSELISQAKVLTTAQNKLSPVLQSLST